MRGSDAWGVNQCARLSVTADDLGAGAPDERVVWAEDEADASGVHASEPLVAKLFGDRIVAPEVTIAGVGALNEERVVFLTSAGASGIAYWKAGRREILVARRGETRKGGMWSKALRMCKCGSCLIGLAGIGVGVRCASRPGFG
jgi:hypothetical protein